MERTVAMIICRRVRPIVNKADRSNMMKQIKNSNLGNTGGAVVRNKLAIGIEKISMARPKSRAVKRFVDNQFFIFKRPFSKQVKYYSLTTKYMGLRTATPSQAKYTAFIF